MRTVRTVVLKVEFWRCTSLLHDVFMVSGNNSGTKYSSSVRQMNLPCDNISRTEVPINESSFYLLIVYFGTWYSLKQSRSA